MKNKEPMTHEKIKSQLKNSSKTRINKAAEYFFFEDGGPDALLDFALCDIKQYSARAVRVCYKMCDWNYELFYGKEEKIIAQLPKLKLTGLKHSLLRLLYDFGNYLESENSGILFDFCLKSVVDFTSEDKGKKKETPPALAHYSMKILLKILKKYPELRDEVLLVLKPNASEKLENHFLAKIKRAI